MSRIITIEGTDGCGKKTQAQKLYQRLIDEGYRVITISFPNYESISSGPVKMYLGGELAPNADMLDAYQSSALFAVDRLCTMQVLKDELQKNSIIVVDRYVESNMIHQASKIKEEKNRENFINWLLDFEYNVLKLQKPSQIFYLDLPVKKSKSLADNRPNLKSGLKKDIHEQDENHMQHAYHISKKIAKEYNWTIIDCLDDAGNIKPVETIHNEIYNLLNLK